MSVDSFTLDRINKPKIHISFPTAPSGDPFPPTWWRASGIGGLDSIDQADAVNDAPYRLSQWIGNGSSGNYQHFYFQDLPSNYNKYGGSQLRSVAQTTDTLGGYAHKISGFRFTTFFGTSGIHVFSFPNKSPHTRVTIFDSGGLLSLNELNNLPIAVGSVISNLNNTPPGP
jgi:hypothetical protein